MQSITLQTNDAVIASGDILGRLQFAASAESDGGASRLVGPGIQGMAEGTYSSSSNPSSLLFLTSADDNQASKPRLKFSHEGHFLPISGSYNIGEPGNRFNNIYGTGLAGYSLELASNVPSDTTNKLYNDGGTLKFNGSTVGGAGGGGGLDNVVEDTTPQLGGNLDLNSYSVTGVGNINIDGTIEANYIYSDLDGPIVVECKNSTGSTISAGTPVYVSGYYGTNGKALIAPADAADSSKMPAIGLLETALNDDAEGYVHCFGLSVGMSTSSFSVGDTVYVASGEGITNIRPTASNVLVQNIGRVLRSDASQGRILVLGPGRTNDVPNSGHFEQLTVDGQTILAKDGGNVGIGTATPQAKLDVNGTVEFDGLVRWEYPDKALDTSTSTLGYMRLYDEVNGYAGLGASTSSFNIGTSGAINFRVLTDNAERIIVGSNGNTVINEEGHAVNFRVEGDADENLLIARGAGGTDKVGIGCSPSLGKLHLQALYTNNNGHGAIYIDQRNTSSSNGAYNNTGIDLLSRKLVASGVSDTGQIVGADLVATLDGDGSLNNSYGARTWGGIYINNSGSLTNAWGIHPRVINGGYDGASITNAYGVDIFIDGDLYDRIDGDSITTAMGLRIRDIEHATNSWAIYQEGVNDDNYFAGSVGVGAASPSYKLEINGNIGLTNDGFYASPTGVMVGTNGWLYNDGQIAVSHGSFSSDGDAQNSTYILRGSTTNATFTTIRNNGSNVVLASNRTMMFTANIVGRRTNGADNGAYKLEGMLYNDGYGASIIGTPVKTTIGETDSSWDVQATITGAGAGGSDYLNIQVKGATSKDVNWVAKLELLEVGGDITSYTEANILDIDANIIP